MALPNPCPCLPVPAVCVGGGGAACGYCGVADRRSIIARMVHFAFSPKGSEVHPALKLLKDTVCGLFAWHMSWHMSTLGGDVGLVAVMLASFLSCFLSSQWASLLPTPS